MEALTKVVEIGLTIHHMAETAKSNQQSCKLLGSMVQGLTTIAKEMVEFYINEGVSSSAFTFLGNLQRELESAEELVAKAGSMPPLQRFLFAGKYQEDFRDAMTNLNLLLSALNTTNSFLAVKKETAKSKSKAASIDRRLTSLKAKSEREVIPKEVSREEQAIWIQLSKTTDRLMNEVISRNEAKQVFMHHMEELYEADESEGNLSGLFRFLNEEIEKGKVEKDRHTRLFNELLLEVAIRLTLDPPDWAFCPLTGTIMKDPVNVKECTIQTPIERSFAEEWFFERGHKRCPISGQALNTVTLVPNEEVKARIEAWKREANWQKLDAEDGEQGTGGGGSANPSSSAANEAPGSPEEMIAAAKIGDTDAVKEFLARGLDIDAIDKSGYTALIRACRGGRNETAKMLIWNGANLERKNGVVTTPLCAAVAGGHLALVKDLLDKGAYIEGKDSNRFTPLIEAAYSGREEIVKELLNRGADAEAEDHHENTALMKACEKGHIDIVKILVKEVGSPQLKSQCEKSKSLVGCRKQMVGIKRIPAYNEIEQILHQCIECPSSRACL